MELEESKAENLEKVELVRELIIGPDKKAIEAQITGMKDLFTSILAENRRDYERQVMEMKNVFVTILDENRNSFRQQLVELQTILPKMVQSSISQGQKEGYVVLADESKEREHAQKYTKIEAVKEIILGNSIDQMHERVAAMDLSIERTYLQQGQALAALSHEVAENLDQTVQRLSASLDKLIEALQKALQNHDDQKAYRSVVASFFEEAGKKILHP